MSDLLALTDEQCDEYLEICLSNGFSKGTANVSPRDMAKLRPLLKHYAKKAHPFRACVRDNKKRFGPRTNAICAVVKDLIYHSTKWRGNEKGMKKHFEQDDDFVAFASNIPDEFYVWLEEATADDIQQWILLSDQAGYTEEELVELTLSDDDNVMAELYFEDGRVDESDDLIWKTVLREGQWKYSPNRHGEPVAKPMTIVPSGVSDRSTLTVSMEELVKNFEDGTVEHVTVPLSHDDRAEENTGFVRKLKLEKDEDGKNVIRAGIHFTEPDVREKALRGTIANTSGGILFDYINKESGSKGTVLGHVALTNRPWLNGMKPFGSADLAEDVKILPFSEGGTEDRGGEIVPDKKDENKEPEPFNFEEAFGLSEDEVKARLAEHADLAKKDRERNVDDTVKAWEDAGKSPAVLVEARKIMLADEGSTVLNLSEDGKKEETLTATDIVERLVEASAELKLSEKDKITEKDLAKGGKPKDGDEQEEEVKLSAAERKVATHLFLREGFSEDEAAAEAKRRSGEKKSQKEEVN